MIKDLYLYLILFILLNCSQNSNRTEASLQRIKLLYEQKNYSECIYEMDNILVKDTLNTELIFKKAICYYKLENYGTAKVYFDRCVKINYRASDSFYNIALCYSALNKDSLALEFSKKALELNPNDKKIKDFINFTQSNIDWHKYIEESNKKNKGKQIEFSKKGV